jgi:outer membrane protein OmpA-like peptidoglycan-associated protein
MHHWIWLAVAAAAGALTPLLAQRFGWAADLEDYWLKRIGLVLAVPLVLVVAHLVSGKPGLLLEAALALVIAYIAGGLIGGAPVRLLPGRYEGWWVGLFVTGVIWAVFAITAYGKIEPELRERVTAAVQEAGGDPLNFDVAGRDVLLPSDADKRDEVAKHVLDVAGVRLVAEVDGLTGAALAAKTIAKLTAEADAAKAEATAKAEAAAKVEAEAEAKAKAEEAAHAAAAAKPAAKASKAEVAVKAEAAAKPETAAKADAPKDQAAHAATEHAATEHAATPDAAAPQPATAPVKLADAAGTATAIYDSKSCQTKLSAVVAEEQINFEPKSAVLATKSLPVLARLAGVIALCLNAQIEVAGHTDSGGKKARNQALSQERAEAVVQNLTRIGVGSAKLAAVGYGATKPADSNATPEGRAKNRRIEFLVK